MTSRQKKEKARELQNWACKKISEAIGMEWGHDLDIESRQMGENGCDVRLSKAAKELFPFSIECKHAKALDLNAAIRQAKQNQTAGTAWALVLKKTSRLPRERIPPIVVLDAEVFFDIIKKLCNK